MEVELTTIKWAPPYVKVELNSAKRTIAFEIAYDNISNDLKIMKKEVVEKPPVEEKVKAEEGKKSNVLADEENNNGIVLEADVNHLDITHDQSIVMTAGGV